MVILLCIILSITTILHGSEKEYRNLIHIDYCQSNTSSSNHNALENNQFCIDSSYESVNPTKLNNKILYYEEPTYYVRQEDTHQAKNYTTLCCGCITCSTILSVIGFLVFQSP